MIHDCLRRPVLIVDGISDRPEPRPVQPPESGAVVAIPQVGGLHHRYERPRSLNEAILDAVWIQGQPISPSHWLRLVLYPCGLPRLSTLQGSAR
jgi:hypothetical protein